jgi:hypothetical protein
MLLPQLIAAFEGDGLSHRPAPKKPPPRRATQRVVDSEKRRLRRNDFSIGLGRPRGVFTLAVEATSSPVNPG